MRKLIVAEVSMFKNIEYDLLNISKQMEYLDTQKDVESFNEEHKSSGANKLVTENEKEEEKKSAKNRSSSSSLELVVDELKPKRVLGKSMLN